MKVERDELLPATVTLGRRTPTFTAGTTPPALLADHRTAVWARLEVETGSVVLTEDDPPYQHTVAAGRAVVLIPNRAHRIAPSADARFAVQFFDDPG